MKTDAPTTKAGKKARTHENILDSAARLVRERGISGAKVAEVMEGAGLTVGGFYAHFASKEALVDEALRRTSAKLRVHLFKGIEEKPKEDRAIVLLKRYLSVAHRDEYVHGCPMPAVLGEVGTTKPEHAEVVAEQLEALGAELAPHLPDAGLPRRQLALGLAAMMVGALSIARATKGTSLSEDVLKASRALGAKLLGR
ncbi:MAG: TetR/AcrR family transcriptional regulator [Polyangiaceae bacterium]